MKNLSVLDLSLLDLAIGGCGRVATAPQKTLVNISHLARDFGFGFGEIPQVAAIEKTVNGALSLAESGDWCGTPTPECDDAECDDTEDCTLDDELPAAPGYVFELPVDIRDHRTPDAVRDHRTPAVEPETIVRDHRR